MGLREEFQKILIEEAQELDRINKIFPVNEPAVQHISDFSAKEGQSVQAALDAEIKKLREFKP